MCACQPSQKSQMYTVTGELDDSTHHGKKIYVMRYDDQKMIDSTFIEGNKFVFKGQVDTASLCRIDVDRSSFSILVLEGGDVVVDLKKHVFPSGTPQNEALSQIAKEEEAIFADMDQKLSEIKEKFANDKEAYTEARKQYMETFKAGMAQKATELYAIHNDDAVGFYLLFSPYMDYISNDEKEAIMSTFGPWLKSRKMVTETMMRLQAVKNTAEGKPFVDIKGKDAEGNPVEINEVFLEYYRYVVMSILGKDNEDLLAQLEKTAIADKSENLQWVYLSNYATVAAKSGDLKLTETLYKRMLANNKEDTAAYLALASYYRFAETPDADKILEICEEAKANAYQGDYSYMPYMTIAYLLKGEGAVALENMEEYMSMSGYTVQTCNLFALCALYNGNDEIYDEMKNVLETAGYELSVLVEKYKNDLITIEEALTDMGGDI